MTLAQFLICKRKNLPCSSLLAANLSPSPRIYDIPESPLVWLYPCLEIVGLFILLSALLTRRKLALVFGVAFLACGAVPERDISLLVGGVLYSIAIFMFIKK